MQSQQTPSQRVERRVIAVLRARGQDLVRALPDGLEPIEHRGVGFVLLDYARVRPMHLGPVRLGRAIDRLSWKLPVLHRRSDRANRGVWAGRRWSSAGRLARFAEYQLQRGLAHNAACGLLPEPSRAAWFQHREEGLHTELEVRSGSGPATTRTAYLRMEAYGQLSGSVFANVRAAEEELQSWGGPLLGSSSLAECDTAGFATGPFGLQPMTVHSLQTASLPELLPDIESAVEFDSAFRVVRRRLQPAPGRLEAWRQLPSDPLQMPPEGAYSVG